MAGLAMHERPGNDTSARTLAMLNDAFRRSFTGGQVVITRGVAALPEQECAALLEKVRTFDRFDEDNDPYGEHDFAAIDHGGTRYFWKIDAFDRSLNGASPNPFDQVLTRRVLTVMRTDEY